MLILQRGVLVACATTAITAQSIQRRQSSPIESCPGYTASNVVVKDSSITADLTLAGSACNTYGTDLVNLTLQVEYQTESRLHVQIFDREKNVYQIPEAVIPRPSGSVSAASSSLVFNYTTSPFSFTVSRKGSSGPALFNTTGSQLVFQNQYLRLRTSLPNSPHLYGLGEHTNTFQLPINNFTRTLWNTDNPWVPPDQNLYGSHPVYYEHRSDEGTHGVFLLNSNGMDIKINNTQQDGQYLEYNTLGGIFDFYFMSGPTPEDVSKQYAQIVGLPVMIPYWSLGYHQCKYGWQDVYEVAEVIANYSQAGIPLETLWNDIDYMNLRQDFTTDPDRYPLDKFREIIDYLHEHQQYSVLMTDPPIPKIEYGPYNRGVAKDVFLKTANGSLFTSVMWPGVVVVPDWFAPNTQEFWTNEIKTFFDPATGIDIDGLWIDMNEDSLFCTYPCPDPAQTARDNNNPPTPPPVRNNSGRVIPGFPPDFQPSGTNSSAAGKRAKIDLIDRAPSNAPDFQSQAVISGLLKRADGDMLGLPGRDLISPKYRIRNTKGDLSNYGIFTDIAHSNGLVEYDTHNIYGLMMAQQSRNALISRRPGRRPLMISRSTFAGSGAHVGHWLGDNASNWTQYRFQMSGLLQYTSLYQIPMVGSDVCGFNNNTWDTICARWAMLAAFAPFYRNHADYSAAPQEFYRWPLVTQAAKIAMDARFRLMDYIYTAFQRQTVDGTPLISPLWFKYPTDTNTFPIDLQYLYGDHILVAPVTGDEATSVDIYLPNDVFYDFWTSVPVDGKGATITLNDVPFTAIPVYYRGGGILPLRVTGTNTTTELRKKDFYLVIAPGTDNKASGSLYLDDGDSLTPSSVSSLQFSYDGTTISSNGTFSYDPGVKISYLLLLGAKESMKVDGHNSEYKSANQTLTIDGPFSLTSSWQVRITS